MRRDVLLVRPNGHIVLRFRSDNPGVWLFHCHIEWHVDSGLIATLISSPLEIQKQLGGKIPEQHFDACNTLNPPMPYEGNAAGNTQDLLNLQGQNLSPKPLPAGFTARGIVALVFSCIAGILGVAVVAWYGLGEMGTIAEQREEAKINVMSKIGGTDETASSGITVPAYGGTGR
jgi:iron transport multicopper oxidase